MIASVSSDHEIHNWWSEIPINAMKHGVGLFQLSTLLLISDSVYTDYPANRSTSCRKFIPVERSHLFAEFRRNPNKFYLNILPTRSEMTLRVDLVEVLSRYVSSESKLDQELSPKWIDDQRIHKSFEKFASAELQEVEEKRSERETEFQSFRIDKGPANIEYELSYPGTSNIGSLGASMWVWTSFSKGFDDVSGAMLRGHPPSNMPLKPSIQTCSFSTSQQFTE
ncbi:unnamed protein product [Fraxinus pennsylvanica]|uniref:Lipoxygenase domain-containing protein n=1 Tax=Fraxinus pennsylvanica TaxID=56036 RepID=A0AAD2E2G4_9LAMI|nr:unnamed protein product [Fraxinus pennsylvanica]